MKNKAAVASLKKWFLTHKRDLPWREPLTPYSVWVSEVMLQQTQVKTVIPYFHRWMDTFPTIHDLSKAPLEKVIKLWEGLGYYSRARNLHKGAKEVVGRYGGTLPSDPKKLIQISGIGPYTLGAILSFAFRKKATLIDGNVKRVMARFLGLKIDLNRPINHQKLDQILHEMIPEKEPWIFNEALMELGALVCSPQAPSCSLCPLKSNCYAYQHCAQNELPLKTVRKKTIKLNRAVFILEYKKSILIQKVMSDIMQDLYEFPYFEFKYQKGFDILDDERLSAWASLSKEVITLPKVSHGFTHFRVTLWPFHFKLNKKIPYEDFAWHSIEDLKQKPFSSGHRRVMAHFVESFA